jgi:site-specific recombinase XerD
MGTITHLHDRSTDRGPTSLTVLADSYRLGLEAQNKSPRTIQTYLEAITRLDTFLAAEGRPREVDRLGREDIEAFIAEVLRTQSPATASNRYRALQSFFRWAIEEEEIERSPMARMKPPKVPEKPVPILREADKRALLKACEGRDFADLRDGAIIRLLLDTGMRREELARLAVDDLDLRDKSVRVVGKGGKVRDCTFGLRTARAIDRYLRRARPRHPHANADGLWLGHAGPMTGNGIYQAVLRRAEQAGVEGISPHTFRHSWAHDLKASGMQDPELMHLAGWSSAQMPQRYGASAVGERARSAYRRMSPVDRL